MTLVSKVVKGSCNTLVHISILENMGGMVDLSCWCLIANSMRSHTFKYCSHTAMEMAATAFDNFNQVMADKLISWFKGEYEYQPPVSKTTVAQPPP